MENDRLIEVLNMIKEPFKNEKRDYHGFTSYGMCYVVNNMVSSELITREERMEIRKVFLANFPNPHNEFKEFFHSELWLDNEGLHSHWWQTIVKNPQGNKIRIAYLNALIDKFK